MKGKTEGAEEGWWRGSRMCKGKKVKQEGKELRGMTTVGGCGERG